jgi:hypothetical protein
MAVPINIIAAHRNLTDHGFATDESRHCAASRPFTNAKTQALCQIQTNINGHFFPCGNAVSAAKMCRRDRVSIHIDARHVSDIVRRNMGDNLAAILTFAIF